MLTDIFKKKNEDVDIQPKVEVKDDEKIYDRRRK